MGRDEAESLATRLKTCRKARGFSQQEVAHGAGMSQSDVSKLERGDMLTTTRVAQLAKFLGVDSYWLATGEGAAPAVMSSAVVAEPVATPYLPGFEAVSIPVLATAASMGPGADQHDDVVVGRLTVSPQWVAKNLKPLSRLENLRFIHGYGDSMEPTFCDGDILLVDAGVPAIRVDGIYVLEANDRLYIKRVRQRMDGSFEISSDNPNVKTVDVLNGSHTVGVKGRVIWVWNGRKL